MSIAATDLYIASYLTSEAAIVEDDVTSLGGGLPSAGSVFGHPIKTGGDLTPAGSSDIEAVSTSGIDARSVTVRARDSHGVLVTSDTVALTGINSVQVTFPSSLPVFTIEWVKVASDLSADITIQVFGGGTVLAKLDRLDLNASGPYGTSHPRFAHKMFVNAAAQTGAITRYDKAFWINNTNTGLDAVTPVYRLTADPQARIRQGIHPSIDDTASIINRVTAPAGVTFVDDNVDQTGSTLASSALHYQGVWFEFAAQANDPNAPFESTFTTQITAMST